MENGNHREGGQAAEQLGEVMNDLQRGFDSTSYLDMLIQAESGANDGARAQAQALIEEIKGCFSRAITTLNSSSTTQRNGFLNPLDLPTPTPHSNSHPLRSNHRRRNSRPRDEGTGSSQEMLFLENPDDCYAWRINEQREVQNSAYPRVYYECAYKDELNCCATKTVRRLEEHEHDPSNSRSMYEVLYSGQHTCMQFNE